MSFENVNIENISGCPETGNSSGLKTRLYFAPASYFFDTPLPSPSGTFDSEIRIQNEILIKKNNQLRYIDILIDENELRISLPGSKQKKRAVSNLTVFILGFESKVLGFIERCKNVPLIFFIQDANGTNWQIGNLRNRAFIESAEVTSGKKYEDNSGALLTITCNSPLFLYNFSLDNFSKPGDFNNDFNNDFFTTYD